MFPFDSLLHVLALASALLIGISLGLLGSGGAAVTVPVLVYLMGYSPTVAIANSLFIVGITSLAGGSINLKRGLVKWNPLIWFGIPSVVTVLFTRRIILPMLPQTILKIGSYELSRDSFLLVMFAVMLVIVAYRMVYSPPMKVHEEKGKAIYLSILVGVLVGFLTGMLGIGGGFMIVPVLVLYFGLESKTAVGTSLWLIAMNSLVGFSGNTAHESSSWSVLISFTALSVLGMFIGIWISKFVSAQRFKLLFGYFIIFLGVIIIAERLLSTFNIYKG